MTGKRGPTEPGGTSYELASVLTSLTKRVASERALPYRMSHLAREQSPPFQSSGTDTHLSINVTVQVVRH